MGISNLNLVAAAWRDVLQNSCSKPLLKKQLNHTYEKLHRGIFYNNCAAEQTFFRIAPFCRTSLSNCLCRIATVQFLNHFLSVQYYSISQPLNCWLNFTDISTYLLRYYFWRVLILEKLVKNIFWSACILFGTTCEWYTDDIRVLRSHISVHTSDIQMAYEWHTSIYERHTDDI